MEQGFRSSMNVLHTWAGVVLGALLFAIFWMGTLSVYDREIDRWMAPMTRVALPDKPTSFDALRGTYDAAVAAGARSWTMLQPSERQPVVRIVYRDGEEPLSLYFDPVTGAALPKAGTWAGTRFFYPFHYRLHLRAWDIGEWLVGIAAMTMLLLCVSGLIIHRKMIAEFFMLRTRQKSARVVLDLHTVAGVLGLPFNFIIALSGLIILFIAFFPSGWQAVLSGPEILQRGGLQRLFAAQGEKAGHSDVSRSARREGQADVGRSRAVGNRGAASRRCRRVRQRPSVLRSRHRQERADDPFRRRHRRRAAPERRDEAGRQAQRFISGMHQIQFRHWTLRALYFALGLFGCVLILSGFLVWLQGRRRRHAAEGRSGVRIVEVIAVSSMPGIIAASVSFMVINRILPLGVSFMGIERYALEIWGFYLVWIATLAHPGVVRAWPGPSSAARSLRWPCLRSS